MESPARITHCMSMNPTATALRDFLQHIASDTTKSALRGSIGLPTANIDSSNVVLVTTDSICAAAATAMDSVTGEANPDRMLYVFTVGSANYAVVDTAMFEGYSLVPVYFFSSTWVYGDIVGW